MTISKFFVQKHISSDCEARYWDWVDTDENYEILIERLKNKWNGWFDGVRIVEKTFDAETFIITTKTIKTFKRESHWDEDTHKWYTEYRYTEYKDYTDEKNF